MNNEDKSTIKNEQNYINNNFINWGISLIILAPILGLLSIYVYSFLIGGFIQGDREMQILMILGGVSTIGVGISLVIIGCTKNIIQKFPKNINI
ncbi:MAG: hypothetical protein RSD22_06350 [Romboutsia sp.]